MRRSVSVALGSWLFAMAAAAQPGEEANLLANAGFEGPAGDAGVLPTNWNYQTSADQKTGISTVFSRSGKQSLAIRGHGARDGFQALSQDVNVQEGAAYRLLAYLRNSREDPLNGEHAYGQLVVEWQNASGEEVGRSWSESWDGSISRLRWERIALKKVEAPAGAVKAIVGIHLYEGEDGATGSFFVDDMVFTFR